jgi:membrane protein implicated in regulation of membrane protease activity
MTWWGWMILGAVLFGAELFAVDAQFFLVFLGVSAAIVGLAGMIGISAPEWVQWMAFAVLSLFSMFTFRKSLYQKIRGGVEGFKEGIAGEQVTITESLEPGAEGRVDFRGTLWTVRNIGERPISAGSRADVVKTEGLTLHIKAD